MFGPADLEKVRDETYRCVVDMLRTLVRFNHETWEPDPEGEAIDWHDFREILDELEERANFNKGSWDAPAVDITGGVESSEYVRRMREDRTDG